MGSLVLLTGLGAGAYLLLGGHASVEQRIAKAQKLEQAGGRGGAIIELKNALQMAPNNASARLELGRIEYASNDFVNAEKEIRKAISLKGNNPEASILLARILLMSNHPQKLLDDITPLSGAPAEGNATILALRAQAQRQLGSNPSESLLQADQLAPDLPDTLVARADQAYALRHYEEALALVEKALTKGPRADIQVMQGNLLRALNRQDEAIAVYEKALATDPGNVPARLAIIQIYLGKSNLDKAGSEVKNLQKQAPNNLMAHYLDALIDFRRNQLDAANDKLQQVLLSAPDFAPANLLAGAIALGQGKRESAISFLNHVLQLAPEHILARKLLANAMLGSGRADQAQQLIANMKNDNGDPLLLALQGGIALSKGDYMEARQKLEQASTLAPADQKLISGLAASNMASGDKLGAIAALGRIAALDTKTHQADALLVMAFIKDKRYDDAMKVIADLDRRFPNLPVSSNLRGTVDIARKDIDHARQGFSRALELDPAYFPAASNLALLDLADKKISAARGRYLSVLKQNPKESRALTALAALAAQENNEAEYLSLLEQAKKANSADANARQLIIRYWLAKRDAGKALVEARSALTTTGRQDFLEMVGDAQLQQNDTANAVVSFGHWTQANPNNPYAFYRLAQAQSLSQNDQTALKSLDKALSLRPTYTEASLSKALLLAKTDHAAEGIKIARAVQSRNPEQEAGFLAEADILFVEKKFLEAAKLFARSAQLAGNGMPMVRAYKAYAAAGQEGEGEIQLLLWLKAHPDDQAVRAVLASAQLNAGHLQEAAANYRTLVKANPSDLVAYNNLAWLLGQLKDPQALAISAQAYKLAPKNASVQDTYGWQLNLAGQPAQALPLLREAIKSQADNVVIRWHLAATLAQSGNKQEASVELDRLLASQVVFPQRAEAQVLLAQLRGK